MMKWEYDNYEKMYIAPFVEDVGFSLKLEGVTWSVELYDTNHGVPMPGTVVSEFCTKYLPEAPLVPSAPLVEANKAIAEFLRSEADKFYKD